MRNLGTRFNESNILSCRGGDKDELETALLILYRAMEVDFSELTPSEDRVADGLIGWYKAIDPADPYRSACPAYAYVNLNTGINLLYLIDVPSEGCRGGSLELDLIMRREKLVPDSLD